MRMVVVAGLPAIILMSGLTTTMARAAAFTKTTGEGATVRLGSHATWDKSCQGTPARIEIVQAPQHGRLSSRVETITITRVDYGTHGCLGHQALATAVYYTPQPGFIGTDRFYYTSITRKGGPVPQNGTVIVR